MPGDATDRPHPTSKGWEHLIVQDLQSGSVCYNRPQESEDGDYHDYTYRSKHTVR